MVAKWQSNLPRVLRQIEVANQSLVKDIAALAEESIVHGSPLTTAPGQPSDLRKPGKWKTVYPSDHEAIIGSNDPSARSVEDGVSYKHGGRLIKKLKSGRGGFHSVKLTQQNGDKLIRKAVERVKSA